MIEYILDCLAEWRPLIMRCRAAITLNKTKQSQTTFNISYELANSPAVSARWDRLHFILKSCVRVGAQKYCYMQYTVSSHWTAI